MNFDFETQHNLVLIINWVDNVNGHCKEFLIDEQIALTKG